MASMLATLVELPRSGNRSDREAELSVLVAQLRSELATLCEEVASLRHPPLSLLAASSLRYAALP